MHALLATGGVQDALDSVETQLCAQGQQYTQSTSTGIARLSLNADIIHFGGMLKPQEYPPWIAELGEHMEAVRRGISISWLMQWSM